MRPHKAVSLPLVLSLICNVWAVTAKHLMVPSQWYVIKFLPDAISEMFFTEIFSLPLFSVKITITTVANLIEYILYARHVESILHWIRTVTLCSGDS